MKKITLLLLTFLYSSLSYGQYLSEGFESSTSLPDNWVLTQTNTSKTWEISTTTANNGTNGATVSYDYSQDETLTSPSIDLSSATNPRLVFYWSMSYYWSVDPYNNYDFIVSIDDGTNVTQLFTEADAGTFTTYQWYEQTIDLSAYVGLSDVKILFNYTGNDGASLYLDDISVEETPTAPNCVENVSPTGTDVSITNDTVLITWDAPSTGEAPTGYEVFWGQTPNSLTSLGVTTNTFINIGGSSVDYGNTNYYSIVAQNNGVSAVNCSEYSYTHEAAASIPFSTDFTGYPGPGFSESAGPFGDPDASVTSSAWAASGAFLNDATLGAGVKVNIWSTTTDEYLISPTFDLSAGTHYLNMDVGITNYNSTAADADGMDADDDYVAVVLSEDDGTTWTELHRWDSSSSLTNVSEPMTEVTLSTTSATAKIALYAFSGVSGADYDFHVTNFQITTETLGTSTNTLEGFSLYPTIVKEELNFRSQNKVEAITVFNLLGQKVFSGAPNTNNSSINLSNLRPGVYVVKVSAEGKTGSYKIVKE